MYNEPFKRFQIGPLRIMDADVEPDANIQASKIAFVPDTKDLDHQITGTRNGFNTEFNSRFDFKPGSVVVIRSGLELTPAVDFEEVGANKIVFAAPVDIDENLIFYYKKLP